MSLGCGYPVMLMRSHSPRCGEDCSATLAQHGAAEARCNRCGFAPLELAYSELEAYNTGSDGVCYVCGGFQSPGQCLSCGGPVFSRMSECLARRARRVAGPREPCC
eukprot:5246827-Prymnesium_polylepis.1